MAQIETVHVHAFRWDSIYDPRKMAVWTAHRPLRGDVVWEGPNVAYGRHFAAAPLDDERMEFFEDSNRRDDARRVVLLDNMGAITLASARCKERGREEYGLAAYLEAYPGVEGAKMFVETYDLPWDDADASAEALLADGEVGA